MKLKQQIILLISLSLLIPSLAITSISIYKMQNKAKADIAQFRTDELNKLKLYLKHITDIAYGMIEVRNAQLEDSVAMFEKKDSTFQSAKFKAKMKEQLLTELSKIRFDKGEGYFWVTDNKEPYPVMQMHAEKPELKGQILEGAKYNVEKEKGMNIYQVRAQLCNDKGDGFVEYIMKKPGTDKVENKISYSRLYKPLGWIVSTGFYTDQIDEAMLSKNEALNDQLQEMILYIVSVGAVILGIGVFISFYFSRQLTNAILTIKEKLKELAQGKQVEAVVTHRKDEVGDMTHSLNNLVEGLESYTGFAKEIGQGNLDQSFTPLSTDDILGNELIVMRDNLKKAARDKSLRDWANEGHAQLGEVLRRNNTDTKGLTDEILKELVKYLKINQGALYIIADSGNDDDQWLELMATYAYDKKKHDHRRIAVGEGITGQCVLERATIHLREVPEGYINITSGLGQALPRTILIVPLIYNQIVYGVMEMASFKVFENYQISFIEKMAESIASTIATVQTNERTKKLLEQSQQMSEELKAQEEELRQNQEELQATQEQMRRRQLDLEQENEMLKRGKSSVNGNGHSNDNGSSNGVHSVHPEAVAI